MRSIELTDETYRRLLRQAQSFDDKPETVIDRLLNALESGREVMDKGSETHRPSNAPTRKKLELLPESAYWVPILEYLAGVGGSAPSAVVVEALGAQLKDRLTEADLDRVKSGERRWQNRARFARLRMREMGLLSDSSPRGIWEITARGRDYLREEMRG